MTLVSNGDRRKIEFNGKAASFGWNDLGEFQMPAGESSLEVASITHWVVSLLPMPSAGVQPGKAINFSIADLRDT